MIKRWISSMVNGLGYDVKRIGGWWRGRPVPREVTARFSEEDIAVARRVERFTATSLARVCSLIRAVRYIVRHRIDGDFVECGVWRGGSMMAIALTLIDEGVYDRDLYLFDTFDGMSAPTDKDRAAGGISAAEMLAATPKESGELWCLAGLDEVKANLASTGYPDDRIHYVRGRVEETLPCPNPSQISLLRLDTDWYESTLHELNHLYPRLRAGGVLVIDDYGDWEGAREAVDEYVRSHPEYPILLNVIDETGRLVIKVPPGVRDSEWNQPELSAER
jgi:O-methyltransferase